MSTVTRSGRRDIPGRGSAHEHRGGLGVAVAAVTPEQVTRVKSSDQTVPQMSTRPFDRLKGVRDGVDDRGADQGVSLDRERRARAFGDPIAPRFRPVLTRARPLRRAPLHVDDADLATLPSGVRGDHPVQRLLRRDTSLEQVEQLLTVLEPRPTLRRDRSDARSNPGDRVAHARAPRRDGDAGFARLAIDRDDRKGVEFELRSPFDRFLPDRRCHEEEDTANAWETPPSHHGHPFLSLVIGQG